MMAEKMGQSLQVCVRFCVCVWVGGCAIARVAGMWRLSGQLYTHARTTLKPKQTQHTHARAHTQIQLPLESRNSVGAGASGGRGVKLAFQDDSANNGSARET